MFFKLFLKFKYFSLYFLLCLNCRCDESSIFIRNSVYFLKTGMEKPQSCKLVDLVAREIRKKHLNEDIRHTQIRNRSRHNKLKQMYEIPQHNQHMLYLYSNYHGNQFNINENSFDLLDCERKEEVVPIVREMQMKLNRGIYALWASRKEQSKNYCFPWNRKILYLSFIVATVVCVGCWLAELIAKAAGKAEEFDAVRSLFYVLPLVTILLILVVCCSFLVKTLNTDYHIFNYDRQILKASLLILRPYQQKLQELDMKLECDEEMTWVRIRKEMVPSQECIYNQLPVMKFAESKVFSSSIQSSQKN